MQSYGEAKDHVPLSVHSAPTFGFVLSNEQFPAPYLVELGASAERAGFDAIWASDHFQPWQDNEGHSSLAWLTLAAVGQRTKRAVMGTGVTCPTYRFHPSVVAHGFATLGVLYPGRVWLGVGTGEAINEEAGTGQWGPYSERSARLVEAVKLIRELWRGDVVNFQGEYYTVKSTKLYDVPAQPVPIYFGVQGKKSMRMAGEHGDGLITDAVSATKPESRAAFEEGARAAGKDPSKLPIIAETWVLVGNKDEARKYAQLWRFMPNALGGYTDDPDPRAIQRRAEQEVPLEKVYEGWIIAPDPATHIEGIKRLLDAGVTTVIVHSPQVDQESVIDFYGKQVLPALRSG